MESEMDGYNSAICWVLGYLNGRGEGGGTLYVEILEQNDEDAIVAYAKRNGEMRFTGLSKYLRSRKT
jgi:hypothetical protein